MGGGVDEQDLVLSPHRDGVLDVPREHHTSAGMDPDSDGVEDSLSPQIDHGHGAVVVIRHEGQAPIGGGGGGKRPVPGRVGAPEGKTLRVEDLEPVGPFDRKQVTAVRHRPGEERSAPVAGAQAPGFPAARQPVPGHRVALEAGHGNGPRAGRHHAEGRARRGNGGPNSPSRDIHQGHPIAPRHRHQGGRSVGREGDLVWIQANVQHGHGPEPSRGPPFRRPLGQLRPDPLGVAGERGAELWVLAEVGELRHPDRARHPIRRGARPHGFANPPNQCREVVAKPNQIGEATRPKMTGHHRRGLQRRQRVEHRDPVGRMGFTHVGAGLVHEHIPGGEHPLGRVPGDQIAGGVGRPRVEDLDGPSAQVEVPPIADDRIGNGRPAAGQLIAVGGRRRPGGKGPGHSSPALGEGPARLAVREDREGAAGQAGDA